MLQSLKLGTGNLAPTLLEILGLPKPDTMRGCSLIQPIGSALSRSRIPQTLGV